MARRSLRPQLNQIRAWVRQGRTDAWIAHQLEVSASELREFRRQHGLSPDDEDPTADDLDLRDEIEAEIEAATEAEEEEEDEDEEDADGDGEEDEDSGEERSAGGDGRAQGSGDGPRKRRRRGRRGGRRRRRPELQATFDHGEKDGYGLWLDPAVQDDTVYAENWAGHREVTVRIEADQIVIRRAGEDEASGEGTDSGDDAPEDDAGNGDD